MAHFLKGNTDNKIVDDILQNAVKQGDAPELDYIYLEEHDETQSTGSDGVLENVDGELYFDGNKYIKNMGTGGEAALAISADNKGVAPGDGTVVVGSTVTAGNYSTYVGTSQYENTGNSKVGIGNDYKLGSYNNAIGIGNMCEVGADYTIAIGKYAKASGSNAIAIGTGTSKSLSPKATGEKSITIGSGCSSSQTNNVTIGYGVNNNAMNTIAIGDNIDIRYNYGVAIGSGTIKTIDHGYAVVFNKIRFIPLNANDSYTIYETDRAILCDSNGVTYKAPSSTITTTEPSLLIVWRT